MIVRRLWPVSSGWQSSVTELERMRRDVERLFESLGGTSAAWPEAGVFPPVNVTQDADNYYVRAELPGVKASDLEVTTARNTLSLGGRRTVLPEAEKVSYHRCERAEGEFRRTITLPGEFSAQKIEARHVNGILTVTLPKAEAAKPKQISVKTA